MRLTTFALVLLCAVLVSASLSPRQVLDDPHIKKLQLLTEAYKMGLVEEQLYLKQQEKILNAMTGTQCLYTYEAYDYELETNDKYVNMTVNPQVQWLIALIKDGMPKSYNDMIPCTGKSFWYSPTYLASGAFDPFGNMLPFDSAIAQQERTLTNVGLNLYDGGVWSVALALEGYAGLVELYLRSSLYQSTTGANAQAGGLIQIRAIASRYKYGASKISGDALASVKLPGNMSHVKLQDPTCCGECCDQVAERKVGGGYFYRMIGPKYAMHDPVSGDYGWMWKVPPAGPNNDTTTPWNLAGMVHWNDWKPITGENVWGAILGPLQVMYLKECSNITKFETFDKAPAEVQLALSILPAMKALATKLGSLYHCPLGTEMFPADPDEATNVSNENNFSAYAALLALEYTLETYYVGGGDTVLTQGLTDVKNMQAGLLSWFKSKLVMPGYEIEGMKYVFQGGHVTFGGSFTPQNGTQGYAIDCQTWGMTVTGSKIFDESYSDLGITAYQVWQNAKKLSGVYFNGELAGVGYTVKHGTNPIWSGEWSFGAVNMCRKLADEYKRQGKTDWAASLTKDADNMLFWMSKQMEPCDDGTWCGGGLMQVDGSYLYANARFFIPWGWYANPIGATSSTGWSIFTKYNFNPFHLGGGRTTTWFEEKCKNYDDIKDNLTQLRNWYDKIEGF